MPLYQKDNAYARCPVPSTWVASVPPVAAGTGSDSSVLQEIQSPLFNNATAVGVKYLNATLNATYGISSSALVSTLGAVGLAPFAFANTSISHPAVPFSNVYDWSPGIFSSGILGLGFILNAVSFSAVVTAEAAKGAPLSAEEATAYWPLIPFLAHNGTIEAPLFALQLEHTPWSQVVASATQALSGIVNVSYSDFVYEGGTLTLGGLPDGLAESDFTFVDVPLPAYGLPASLQEMGYPAPNSALAWQAPVEIIYFNNERLADTTLQPSLANDSGRFYSLVDSGNHGFNLPSDMLSQIVRVFHGRFSLKLTLTVHWTDAWAANPANLTIPCNTTFVLTFTIGGKNFTITDELLIPSVTAPVFNSIGATGQATQDCQFVGQPATPLPGQFGPGTSQTYAFGDIILKELITVFDYGDTLNVTQKAPRLGFAQKKGTGGNSSTPSTGGSGQGSGQGKGGGIATASRMQAASAVLMSGFYLSFV
ncbi:hypothetical protein RQP46_002839 [Phenoliferia psychrophenolica]